MLSWTKLGSARQTKSHPGTLVCHAGQLYGVGPRLRTFRWGEAGFAEVVTEADGEALLDGTFTLERLVAWDGRLVGVAANGRVVAFDAAAGTWRSHTDASSLFKVKITSRGIPRATAGGALAAFDRERGLVVLWGPAKADGRKDETYVCDGKTWTKVKKGVELADAADERASGFALYFDPAEAAVVRVGLTSVGVFDGKAWAQYPLDDDGVLDRWYPLPCVDRERALVVQPGAKSVVRVERKGDRFVARRVAEFRAPVDQNEHAAFHAGAYDADHRRLLALVDVKRDHVLFGCDLSG